MYKAGLGSRMIWPEPELEPEPFYFFFKSRSTLKIRMELELESRSWHKLGGSRLQQFLKFCKSNDF